MIRRFSLTACQITKVVGGKLIGQDLKISGLAEPDSNAKGKVVFLFSDKEYDGDASCLVVKEQIDHPASQIIVGDPRHGLYLLLKELIKERRANNSIGRHVTIGPFVVIGPDVMIGDGSRIGAHSVIRSAHIGRNVIIGPGTIIGQPGFGFIRRGKGFLRMPHIGRVIIKDQVEIGSNCVCDQGTFEDTVIGARTKIDSSVHIGHNVKIGKDCVIIAQAGIAGSAKIGDQVVIFGQAGIKEGVRIGANSKVLAKAGVFKSFPEGSVISGIPAREHRLVLRALARLFREKSALTNF